MAGPYSWVASGVVIVLCVFPLFVFHWFPGWIFGWSLMFESIIFRGFYWGPQAGIDSGPLPVSFVVSSSLPGWMPMHSSICSSCY